MITLMSTLGTIAGIAAIGIIVGVTIYLIYSKGKSDGRRKR